ncbi:MAG: response regulator [Deltaproteobacteria bacterium]|nr:response regulator [Deltaproteobacteria bacterium]
MTSELGIMSESTVLPGAVRLLVVDDDVAICRQVAAGLANAGFQVVTANDAESAIAQVNETPPDIAIIDLGMPTTGGTEVIRHMKQQLGAQVHVIVLTGHDDERSRAEAFDAGTDDYVVKPIGLAELKRRISAALRNQRALVQVRLEKDQADRRLVYGTEATALLAHDLNNGLAVSLSNLSYLIDTIKGDQDQTEALAATLRSVRRMAGLVANFVDIARFEDAAVKPNTQKTRVCHVLQGVIDVNAPSVTKGITFAVDCDDKLEARFDAGLIERVLHNLFGNATRYCNQGGKIVLGARRWHDEGSVEIFVANTGPQIPENIRPNLFGKYVQGKGGKRGMGLYFCRLVAEAHGGRIDYEARADGPAFVVRLPGRA